MYAYITEKKKKSKFFKGERGSTWDKCDFFTRVAKATAVHVNKEVESLVRKEMSSVFPWATSGTVISTCQCPADRQKSCVERRMVLEQTQEAVAERSDENHGARHDHPETRERREKRPVRRRKVKGQRQNEQEILWGNSEVLGLWEGKPTWSWVSLRRSLWALWPLGDCWWSPREQFWLDQVWEKPQGQCFNIFVFSIPSEQWDFLVASLKWQKGWKAHHPKSTTMWTIPKGTALLVTKHLLRLWSDLLLLLPPLLTLHSADLDSPGVGKLDPNTELQLVLSFMPVHKVVLLY